MPDGISIARASHPKGEPPVLDLCEFRACDTTTELSQVLASLVNEHQLSGEHCTSLVRPGEYSLMLIEAPDVEAAELKSAVRWRIKDLIDFHIDDAIIDVFDVPGQRDRGRAPMMYVVAARESIVRNRAELLQQAGLEIDIVDIPELAQRNIAALLPEDEKGVALLYLTNDRGLITLTRQSVLYLSRMIDIGTDVLGRSTSNDLEVFLPDVQNALDTIVLEVQRSLDYYESHFSQPPIGTLVISTRGDEPGGMIDYLNSQLGIAVRSLDLNMIINTDIKVDGSLQLHSLGTIGAALREEQAA